MWRRSRLLAAVAVGVCVLGGDARAACVVDSQPVFHAFETVIDNCPDAGPVSGYIYHMGAPASHNSGTQSFNIVWIPPAPLAMKS